MIVDLREQFVVSNLASVTRRNVKIGVGSQVDRAQPGDRFFMRGFARDDPKHPLIRLRS